MMADVGENRLALAEKVDADLLQFLARLPRRQQRAVLLLLMVVENLLYEMMRERRLREDIE
ncbi:MAG: hypothetical protein AMJ76_01390 [Dehalococcoidia bacterium SM23_28_1]|nr:MAG: hypothetical protein AMJ76_01390 [Dehalococcoidia bacterium SM23_28_1]